MGALNKITTRRGYSDEELKEELHRVVDHSEKIGYDKGFKDASVSYFVKIYNVFTRREIIDKAIMSESEYDNMCFAMQIPAK